MGGGRCTRVGSAQHARGVAACARGPVWGDARAPRNSISTSLPHRGPRCGRRKSAPEFGAKATALTPQTVAPDRALGLSGPSRRLRARGERATADRPVLAKAPPRRLRERRGQLIRNCARAAGPDFWLHCSARSARIHRTRVDPEPPASARAMKTSLLRPVSKGCGGLTSGLHSSRRYRQTS